MTKHVVFSCGFWVLIFAAGEAAAQCHVSGGCTRVTQSTTSACLTSFTNKRKVTNNCSSPLTVFHSNQTEWDSFFNNKPACASLSACDSPLSFSPTTGGGTVPAIVTISVSGTGTAYFPDNWIGVEFSTDGGSTWTTPPYLSPGSIALSNGQTLLLKGTSGDVCYGSGFALYRESSYTTQLGVYDFFGVYTPGACD